MFVCFFLDDCGGFFKERSGIIEILNYLNNYFVDKVCVWVIEM